MTTSSTDKLSELVACYGTKITDDAQFCNAILGDHKSHFKRREIDALTGCVRLGIPARMQANGQGFPLAAQKQDAAERLHDEFGLDRGLAEWCAEAWMVALQHQIAPGPLRPMAAPAAAAANGIPAAPTPATPHAASQAALPARGPTSPPAPPGPPVATAGTAPLFPLDQTGSPAAVAGRSRRGSLGKLPVVIATAGAVVAACLVFLKPGTRAEPITAAPVAGTASAVAGAAAAVATFGASSDAGPAAAAGAGGVFAVPARADIVTDASGVLGKGPELQYIQQRLTLLENRGLRARVLVVPSTGTESIDVFGPRVANAWARAEPGDRMDALVTVAANDRRVRLDVASRLSATLSDDAARRLIDEYFLPAMRSDGLAIALGRLVHQIDSLLEARRLASMPDGEQRKTLDAALGTMMTIAGDWGAASAHLAPVQQARLDAQVATIDALPKPPRGDRKSARQLHASGLAEMSEPGAEKAAAARLRDAHAADPLDVQIANDMAYAELKAGDSASASEGLLQTFRLAPKRTSAWVNLAEVLATTPGSAADTKKIRAGLLLGVLHSQDRERSLDYLRDKSSNADAPQPLRDAAGAVLELVESMPAATDEGLTARIVR